MELGRYRILRPLGQGGMATVYLGEDPLLNRLVAIKVIQAHLSSNDKLIERFTVEAKTIASLRHVNIVEIFDFGFQDDQQFLVMEYIDGQNLQTLCTAMAGRPMPDTVAAAIIYQAAEGLTSAERHGVVHRDIKPENLLFNSAGVLKIADFGIAHIADEQSRTQTGAVLGSPNFMSPEQVEGLKPTPRTDIFSLGGVFYSCLTGKMPFTGGSIPVTLRNICEKPHPPVVERNPDADPFLIEIIDTLLQKVPADRGEGARWLSQKLRGWLNERGVTDPVEHVRAFIDGLNLPTSPTSAGSQFLGMNLPFGTRSQKGGRQNRLRSVFLWGGAAVFVAALGAVAFIWNSNKTAQVVSPASKTQSTSLPVVATKPDGEESLKTEKSPANQTGVHKKIVSKTLSDSSGAVKSNRPGFLWIESAPFGADISLDGKPYGATPVRSWLELPPGKYQLNLNHPKFPPFDTSITVLPGGRKKFKFKLNR